MSYSEVPDQLNERFIAFIALTTHFPISPEIGIFASRINCQLKPFISYRPDPDSSGVDAFLVPWGGRIFYAFPPFSVIAKAIQKIFMDKAEGIIVVPNWKNQPWFSRMTRLLVSNPLPLSSRHNLLYLPNQPDVVHPLKDLQLIAAHVSAK